MLFRKTWYSRHPISPRKRGLVEGTFSYAAHHSERFWCGWRDSNSHWLPRGPLKTVCLAVPPLLQIRTLTRDTTFERTGGFELRLPCIPNLKLSSRGFSRTLWCLQCRLGEPHPGEDASDSNQSDLFDHCVVPMRGRKGGKFCRKRGFPTQFVRDNVKRM